MSDRMLTEKEKRKILLLHNEGHSYNVIAKTVMRSTKSVERVVGEFKSNTPSAFNFPQYIRKPWPYYG